MITATARFNGDLIFPRFWQLLQNVHPASSNALHPGHPRLVLAHCHNVADFLSRVVAWPEAGTHSGMSRKSRFNGIMFHDVLATSARVFDAASRASNLRFMCSADCSGTIAAQPKSVASPILCGGGS